MHTSPSSAYPSQPSQGHQLSSPGASPSTLPSTALSSPTIIPTVLFELPMPTLTPSTVLPESHSVSTSHSSPPDTNPSSALPSNSNPLINPTGPPPTLNSHPMITRSKHGIYKPKAFVTKTAPLDRTLTEPPTYKVAAQYPQWCSAKDEKFDALQRQGTWILVPPSPS